MERGKEEGAEEQGAVDERKVVSFLKMRGKLRGLVSTEHN